VTRAGAAVLLALAGATVLSGCGSHVATQKEIGGGKLTIYASVPLNGPSSVSGRAVIHGATLALSAVHSRIGRYRIVLRPLNDATPVRDEWDPGQTTVNLRSVSHDTTTIGYVGDLNSGASAVSIPVLNRLDIPQISPYSSAVGLTSSGPGASPGEPQKYYPTGIRTFARVIPNDLIQAEVQVTLQRRAGCRNSYVIDDGEFDGEEMATSFELAARAANLPVLGVQAFPPNAPDYRPFAASVASAKPDCLLISAITGSGAVGVTRQLAAALPQAMIFATKGLAESTFTDPSQGGIPASLDPRLLFTAPPDGPGQAPAAARAFYARYRHRYGPPELSAIYGYEAMSLMLSAIATATQDGKRDARRSAVLAAMFDTRDRHSVLGTYSIERDGDTTIHRYGVYIVRGGRLGFWKSLPG
jgi:branched-chain amino acid transport system substrate-binding protein